MAIYAVMQFIAWKDFDKATFNKLYDFINTKFNLKNLGIEKK